MSEPMELDHVLESLEMIGKNYPRVGAAPEWAVYHIKKLILDRDLWKSKAENFKLEIERRNATGKGVGA